MGRRKERRKEKRKGKRNSELSLYDFTFKNNFHFHFYYNHKHPIAVFIFLVPVRHLPFFLLVFVLAFSVNCPDLTDLNESFY